MDDVFGDSTSGFSRSWVTTATVVQHEKPRQMADLFGEIMGEAAAIKGFPMPAPPLAPVSDDMQGECFRIPSSSRRVTQCPLFPPVQHLFTAAGGDPEGPGEILHGFYQRGGVGRYSPGSASLSGRRMAP